MNCGYCNAGVAEKAEETTQSGNAEWLSTFNVNNVLLSCTDRDINLLLATTV